jgi:hypothetical protein
MITAARRRKPVALRICFALGGNDDRMIEPCFDLLCRRGGRKCDRLARTQYDKPAQKRIAPAVSSHDASPVASTRARNLSRIERGAMAFWLAACRSGRWYMAAIQTEESSVPPNN